MPTVRHLSLPLLVLALVGCSESKPREGSSASPPSALTSRSDAKPPAGKLRPGADGPGCPSGSTRVKREGNKVTFVFGDAFLAELEQTAETADKDCMVVIPTASDKSSAIASIKLEGDLTLEDGAEAIEAVETFVRGKAGQSHLHQRQHNGPTDHPLALAREIEREKREFTDCGAEQALNLHARVRLYTDKKPSHGKAKPTQLTVVLDERPCSGS